MVCQVENVTEPRPAAKKRQTGFDCEFLECPPTTVQSECPVCLLVLREPHQVTCCGYAFCRVCIERIQTDKKSCPTCNREQFSVFPDLRLQRSLYEFRVWCPHKTEGCEWSGELSQLEKHVNESPKLHEQLNGCQFAEVECHHCCDLFQRRYVTGHQTEECIRRPFSCDYCGNYGADFEDVTTKHWPVCGFRPVPCPNECGVYPERQNLKHHVSTNCPLTVVNCDFHYAGCEVQLPRKDMPAHLAENLVLHTTKLVASMQEKIQALTLETTALRNALTEKESEIAKQESEIAQLKARQEGDHSSLQAVQAMQSHGVLPVEFTMTEFEKRKRDSDEWFSEPFYSHPRGYKLCLNVNANGRDHTKGTHVSVGVCLMRGEFDDHLQFPFHGRITIQLVNSNFCLYGGKEQHTSTINFGDSITRSRVATEERVSLGCFDDRFLPLSEVEHDPAKKRQFLNDDCLHFRVTRVTNVDQKTQLERQCLTIGSRVCMPPFDFTITGFEQQKDENDISYSPSFHTHPRGYRMCLKMYANGYDTGRGTHVSVFVCLMRGEWDNYLKWPFRGDITIQLLNQIEDKGHREKTLVFTSKTPDSAAARVTAREHTADGLGWPQFISHHTLNYCKIGQFLNSDSPSISHRHANNCQYLKCDSLHFRITKVKLNV